jgi:hypothetical protein
VYYMRGRDFIFANIIQKKFKLLSNCFHTLTNLLSPPICLTVRKLVFRDVEVTCGVFRIAQ